MKSDLFRRTVLVAASLGTAAFSAHVVSASGANEFQISNLVSDLPGVAAFHDPNLVNPWGLASSSTSPIWVSDNGQELSTLYRGSGQPQSLVVQIPGPPTGAVFNGGTSFELSPGQAARFIFATEDGRIAGWRSGTSALTEALVPDAIYKGLAIGNNGSSDHLYAANFHSGNIDVFDSSFHTTTLSGNFTDPNLPAGFAPFNIQNLGNKLYVTYARQDANAEDDVAGAGNGFVDVFDMNGLLLNRLVSQAELNSPWGLAIAPDHFGPFGGDLLVGNFGDGRVNVYNPNTGAFIDTLRDGNGNPIAIDGLWGLKAGNGGQGGNPDDIYFSAGIPGDGAIEDHGLFGSLSALPDGGSSGLMLGASAFGVMAFCRRR